MSLLLDDYGAGAVQNQVILPYNFDPRDYQEDLFRHVVPKAFRNNPITAAVKRAVLVWHRRAGKDKCSINLLVMLGMEEVGNYIYLAPEITQARKIIWQGIDKDGFRFIDHIPKQIIARKTESDMLVELINGSTIQLGGADMYDRLMGTNPKGIILSEYSIMNPMAWNYFRPMLVENQGTAVFIYTARGKNHGYEMMKIAKKRYEEEFDLNWYFSMLTVDDTKRHDGSPVITQEDIQQEVEEGMPPEMVQQEFYCSFEAGMVGAYYADLMAKLHRNNRIGDYPWDPRYPVSTAWDLGLSDANAIIYFQDIDGQVRIIDYAEDKGVPMSSWIKEVREQPYNLDYHIGPHDLEHREYTTGKTRLETANDLGMDFEVVPRMPVPEGINATRELLPICVFNESKCEQLIEALQSYTKVYDEKLRTYRDRPLHDWASHGADAMRQLALGRIDHSGVRDGVPRFKVLTAASGFKVRRQERMMGRG